MDKKTTVSPAEKSEERSERDKTSDVLTKITTWALLLFHYAAIPAGLFVFCKCVLGLVLPWWTILLAPVWWFLAGFFHGGYVITVLILWLFRLMSTPWWVWVVTVIFSLIRLVRFVLDLIRAGH